MKQSLIITRLADRHKELHGRDYAETFEIVVEAGALGDVLFEAGTIIEDIHGIGRYTISISEPFD